MNDVLGLIHTVYCMYCIRGYIHMFRAFLRSAHFHDLKNVRNKLHVMCTLFRTKTKSAYQIGFLAVRKRSQSQPEDYYLNIEAEHWKSVPGHRRTRNLSIPVLCSKTPDKFCLLPILRSSHCVSCSVSCSVSSSAIWALTSLPLGLVSVRL